MAKSSKKSGAGGYLVIAALLTLFIMGFAYPKQPWGPIPARPIAKLVASVAPGIVKQIMPPSAYPTPAPTP